MRIGTHNSMTYLSPKKWYLYPFKFIAKCQKLNIKEQYKLGARIFDIRVSFDKHGIPEFRHGLLSYKGDVYSIMREISELGRGIYVRLILENSKVDYKQEDHFIDFCEEMSNRYSKIKFFGGNRKCDWKVIYQFPTKDLELTQLVSSMMGNKIDDLYPWLFAKLYNKKNLDNNSKAKNVLIDFIEIQ